jgi:hypothetical protein
MNNPRDRELKIAPNSNYANHIGHYWTDSKYLGTKETKEQLSGKSGASDTPPYFTDLIGVNYVNQSAQGDRRTDL